MAGFFFLKDVFETGGLTRGEDEQKKRVLNEAVKRKAKDFHP